MPDARALAPYVPRFYDQSVSSLREENGRGILSGHVPREILSDIYAKVPTNVCSWMDPPSGGGADGGGGGGGAGTALTSSIRIDGILREAPLRDVPSWENPVATKLPLSSLAHPAIPREIFETQS